MKILSALILLLVLLPGCTSRAVVSESSSSRINADAEEEGSVSAGISFAGTEADALVQRARRAEQRGDWEGAIELYRRALDAPGADAELQEEAAFAIGAAHGHVLNPHKDYERGIEAFEEFIRRFPNSPRRELAEANLARYRELAGRP